MRATQRNTSSITPRWTLTVPAAQTAPTIGFTFLPGYRRVMYFHDWGASIAETGEIEIRDIHTSSAP